MHIQKKNIEVFEQNQDMNTSEMIAFLEHLDRCDFCLEQMLEEESRNSCGTAPAYLTEEILKRASSPDIQTAKIITETSRKIQFFCYGLRTAAGVIAALVLLFCIGQVDFSSVHTFSARETIEYTAEQNRPDPASGLHRISETISSGISKGSDKLADYLGSFSNKLIRGGISK